MGFIKVKFRNKILTETTPCWGPIKALRALEAGSTYTGRYS